MNPILLKVIVFSAIFISWNMHFASSAHAESPCCVRQENLPPPYDKTLEEAKKSCESKDLKACFNNREGCVWRCNGVKPTPSPTPTPKPSPTPKPKPSPTATPKPTPVPTPTPKPFGKSELLACAGGSCPLDASANRHCPLECQYYCGEIKPGSGLPRIDPSKMKLLQIQNGSCASAPPAGCKAMSCRRLPPVPLKQKSAF